METRSAEPRLRDELFAVDDREDGRGGDFWAIATVLYVQRRLILSVTLFAAVAAIIISLLLPKWYEGTTRLLVPSEGGSLMGLLSGSIPASARSLLGGSTGDYTRSLALLTSQRAYGSVVDSFDLVRVYELEDAAAPRSEAIEMLADLVSYGVDDEYNFLSISVLDRSPERAADMANFLARTLNRLNLDLHLQSAGNFRSYIEMRYQRAQADLDSVLDATQEFQQQYGLYDLPAQTQGFFEQLGTLRAQLAQAEIQHQALLAQYGPDNAQVQTSREVMQAAERMYQQALQGQERALPIPQGAMPSAVRQYADLERERLLQTAVLETIIPILEQARFEERRRVEAVQVVDRAIPPVKKAKPQRAVIVVVVTFSAFLLVVIYALLLAWWDRSHTRIAHRIRIADQAPAPTASPSASGS